MIRPSALIALAAIALTAGCASTGTGASGQPSGNVTMFTGSPSAAAQPSSQPPPAPTAEASTGPCTTRACIVDDAKQLKGTVAKDNSVMTKVACNKATVKQVVPGTYTVRCTIWYSDGAEWRGIASVLTAAGDVRWEPTSAVSYGSGG